MIIKKTSTYGSIHDIICRSDKNKCYRFYERNRNGNNKYKKRE